MVTMGRWSNTGLGSLFLGVVVLGGTGCDDSGSGPGEGSNVLDASAPTGDGSAGNPDAGLEAGTDAATANDAGTTSDASTGGRRLCLFDPEDPGATPNITQLLEVDIFGVHEVGVADGYFYYVVDGALNRIDIAAAGEPEHVGDITGRPVLYGDQLVWKERDPDVEDTYRLVTAPLSDPSAAAPFVTGLTTEPWNIVADAVHLYWDEGSVGVFRAAWADGVREEFVPGANPLGAVLQGDYYYWLDFHTSQLERATLSDGTREALSGVFFGGPMAATDDAVFWSDTSLGTVEMWTEAAGRVELTPEGDPGELVFADGYLYWSRGWVTGGSLRRMDPNVGALETVLCGIADPGPPFLVEGYLVVNTDDGVFRIAR